jgi:hypothetical protein
MKTAMLKLELDVGQPRFDASWVSEDVLFVNRIFFGLTECQFAALSLFCGMCYSLSGISLVFPERAFPWRRLERPLRAKAHQALFACEW